MVLFMKINLFKKLFKYKKNFFVLALTFFGVFVSNIYTNLTSIEMKSDERFIDRFPNDLTIERIYNFDNLSSHLAKNYDGYDHSELFSISSNQSSIISNAKLEEKAEITLFGIDNNFLNLKIIKDINLFYSFDKFSVIGENNFSNLEFKQCSCVCYLSKEYFNSLKDNNNIEISGLIFNIKGYIDFEHNETLSNVFPVFMPNSTFLNLFSNKTALIKTEIYSKINPYTIDSLNTLKKETIVTVFNTKYNNGNQSLIYLMILSLISEISLCIVCIFSIKNRTNEIGIKLAIGARKSDIVFEICVEMLLISLIGSILGGICSCFLCLIYESLLTCFTSIYYLTLNLSFLMFSISIFSIGSIIFSFTASILSVNSNIESMLKEER